MSLSNAAAQEAVLETIDAVARFTGQSPLACKSPNGQSPLSAALWRHSPKKRRFEGHRHSILAVSLRGDANLEQISNGRSVWRGAAPGSIVLLQADEPTDWFLDGPFEMLHIYLDSARIPWHLKSSRLALPFRDPLLLQLGDATAMALRENAETGTYVAPLLESLQQCLIDRYFTEADALPADRSGCAGLTGYARKQVETHLDAHLAEDVSIETLANLVGLSTGHFNRAFRSTYGISPYQFLLEKRIARAAHFLKETTMKVEEIATATGFSSASHLGMHFKKRMAVSPNAYRR